MLLDLQPNLITCDANTLIASVYINFDRSYFYYIIPSFQQPMVKQL